MKSFKSIIITGIVLGVLSGPALGNGMRNAGIITFFGGLGATLGAFNWSQKCKPGHEVSYLGYDCYADTAKNVHAKLARPAMLGVGVALMIVGPVMIVKGNKRKQRRVELRLAPTQAQLAFRF